MIGLPHPLLALTLAAAGALAPAGCGNAPVNEARAFGPEVPDGPHHPVHVRQPQGLGTLALLAPGEGDAAAAVAVPCRTCHGSAGESGPLVSADAAAGSFHHDVQLTHGGLSCGSCHHPDDREALRLADGARLPASLAMTLCGQCHGAQRRAYDHGLHGGMSGYWDLRRGPRHRNHCLDCHDPHAPAFRGMEPTLPPRDRYLHGHHGEHR